MNNATRIFLGGLFGLLAGMAQASDDVYEVTVTNLTKGQILSPVLVATHMQGNDIYKVGTPASAELAAAAQDADYAGLIAALESNPEVGMVKVGSGVVLPGASETITIGAMKGHDSISLVSMLVTTNDGFIGLSDVGMKKRRGKTIMAYALDAGSEYNSEDCAHIPGPPCGNPFQSPAMPGEGYVYVHSGIHGSGDLDPAMFDWNNPTAKITIRRMND